ncbi:MAG: ROK family protein [Paracoccus sp. (in: a-proteobacteria)]|nr:ROK family protein [Paracoccus sp. (in: a-proteobacteria)]
MRVIGVDLGGTKIAAARVDQAGAVGEVVTTATPRSGPDAIIDAVTALIRPLTGPDVVAVGIGSAGVVDSRSGRVLSATDTLPGYAGTELAARVSAELGLPVVAQNDVDAHAMGEFWMGAARGTGSALVVAVGTGIAAGLIFGGRVVRGAHHVAGEIGHFPTPLAAHLRCPCGRKGHLEAIASGAGIAAHYAALGGAPSDTRAIVTRAHGGEALALRAIAEAARALGGVIAGLVTTFDPEVVVLGGGVAEIGPLWWTPLEDEIRSQLIEPLAEVPLRRSTLGGQAPILGAAKQALDHIARQE